MTVFRRFFARGIILLFGVGVTLSACEGVGEKEGFGTIIGAAGGGLLGAQFGSGKGALVMTAIGALAGSQIGRSIGKGLDKADRAYAAQAQKTALENTRTGQVIAWKNPDSGNEGTVSPTRTYQNPTGEYCREYQQSVTVAGKTEQAYGTACRQPDGSWRIVK